jgi:hypothetical protein
MAIEVLSGNPIITKAMGGSAWITKGESIKISQILWRDIITAGATLVLTNGGSTAILNNILIKRTTEGTAVGTINVMSVLVEPIVVSKLFIHTNNGPTNCAGGTLEIWKE